MKQGRADRRGSLRPRLAQGDSYAGKRGRVVKRVVLAMRDPAVRMIRHLSQRAVGARRSIDVGWTSWWPRPCWPAT